MLHLNIRFLMAVFFALILTIIPLQSLLSSVRPPWVLMLLLYIQFFSPDQFKLTMVITLGLVLDVLLATLLGEHALALVITTWVASSRVRRFHLFGLPEQMALITLLCCLNELILYYIDLCQGFDHSLVMVFGTTFMSVLLWPWIKCHGPRLLP